METVFSKHEVPKIIGQWASANPSLLVHMDFICSTHESCFQTHSYRGEAFTFINKHQNGWDFKISIGLFKTAHILLHEDEIKSVRLEAMQAVIEETDKSIVGRAIIGGILLGPVGAVVGGLTGIGSKKKKLNKHDYLLTFEYNDLDRDFENCVLTLGLKSKYKKDFDKWAEENHIELI